MAIPLEELFDPAFLESLQHLRLIARRVPAGGRFAEHLSRDLGPATVQAFSQRLFKQRSWGAMAESETYAHLEHLRIAGDAERRVEKAGTYIYETG